MKKREAILIEDIYYIDSDMDGIYSSSELKTNQIGEKGEILEWDESEKQWYLLDRGYFEEGTKFVREIK